MRYLVRDSISLNAQGKGKGDFFFFFLTDVEGSLNVKLR